MTLTREQILAARRNRKPVSLWVPEWDGQVYVRVLSVQEQMALSDGVDEKEMPVKIIVHCLVDEAGKRIFDDDDIGELSKEEFPVIMRVFAFVAKQNGLSTKELDEAIASFAQAPDEFSNTE